MDRKHQEDLQRIRGFRLLDDDFLTKCFDRKTDCMELVLQIVLANPDLQVVDVRTQVFVENLFGWMFWRQTAPDESSTWRSSALIRVPGGSGHVITAA